MTNKFKLRWKITGLISSLSKHFFFSFPFITKQTNKQTKTPLFFPSFLLSFFGKLKHIRSEVWSWTKLKSMSSIFLGRSMCNHISAVFADGTTLLSSSFCSSFPTGTEIILKLNFWIFQYIFPKYSWH